MKPKLFPTILLTCLLGLLSTPHALALKPAKDYDALPESLHMPCEKNTVITEDQQQIKSWTIIPKKAKDLHCTLVLAYADAGNMSWFLSQSAIMAQAGYTVVLFDYRGFGQSSPFAINTDYLYYNEFAKDLTAVVKFAKTKYKKNKTGIWCFSMGTIITTLASNDCHPDFIIGDSYATDPVLIKNYHAKSKETIILPAGAADVLTKLQSLQVPMMVFCGDSDPITPMGEITKLKKKNNNVTIYKYTGGHMEGFGVLSRTSPGSDYVAAINTFLKKIKMRS